MAKRLLVNSLDEVKIEFVLAELITGVLVADLNRESVKKTFKDEVVDSSIEEHWAIFRRPNFGDTIDINGKMKSSDGVNLEFNPIAARFQRMSKLLKSWSLKQDGKEIPATPASILQLDPFIANIVGMQLDAALNS